MNSVCRLHRVEKNALHKHLNVQDKRNEGKNRRGECSRRENRDGKSVRRILNSRYAESNSLMLWPPPDLRPLRYYYCDVSGSNWLNLSSNQRFLKFSISFNEFGIQAGMDSSGVATEMVSMNSTVKMRFRNTGTFFGVHVTSTPLVLSFSQLTVATGSVKKFYQRRKSQRTVAVTLIGSKIPLYGGGADLISKEGKPVAAVSLVLDFKVRARAYVLGRVVKPKFYNTVQCSVVMDPKKMNVPISLQKSCTYI